MVRVRVTNDQVLGGKARVQVTYDETLIHIKTPKETSAHQATKPSPPTLDSYARMRDPLTCLDVCVYDGSKHVARYAVITEFNFSDDALEEFSPKEFLTDLCLGRPPAEMTIYQLVESQASWVLSDDCTLTVALWMTTETETAPEIAFHVNYNRKHKNFDVVAEVPAGEEPKSKGVN